MHPAYSVIVFTTASGAGYGLLTLLGLAALFGAGVPQTNSFGVIALGLSLGLITVGLLSSTFHLGHPERSWRAFSQWRTSWLSREGVASVATYLPAGLFAMSWVLIGDFGIFWKLMGMLSAAGAVVTVYCTGMIYASLTTVRQWNNSLVVPAYLVLSMATGTVIFTTLMYMFGAGAIWQVWLAISGSVAAIIVKTLYWNSIDGEARSFTIGQATGLGYLGKIRQIEAPHSQANFVMREMGYKVARSHAEKLRSICLLAGFGTAILMLVFSMFITDWAVLTALVLSVMAVGFGVLVERWLFFAEAQHIVTLFYGAEKA